MSTLSQHHKLNKQAPFIQQATDALTEFFRWRKSPFHFRHLQVLFEAQFFHITTAQALYALIDQNFLRRIQHQAGANQVTFLVPSHVALSPKYQRPLNAHIKSKSKVIAKYDDPDVSAVLGAHFESLVKQELRANQLRIVATHANSYKDRRWTKSLANLDIIAESPDGRAFGVQAKNELKPIELSELLIQLEICDCLRVLPIFIVRYMPWSFLPWILVRGGLLLTLGTQLWPLGYNKLCQEIQSKMSLPQVSTKLRGIAPKMRTRWPIEVATQIPEDAANRLAFWIGTGKIPPSGQGGP